VLTATPPGAKPQKIPGAPRPGRRLRLLDHEHDGPLGELAREPGGERIRLLSAGRNLRQVTPSSAFRSTIP